jgi:hypothetical protein
MIFRPTGAQALGLIFGVLTALAVALALRHRVIEPDEIGRACGVTGATLLCAIRRIVQVFAHYSVFGGLALAAALLNLMRPAITLCALGFISATSGLILYNTSSSACAVILLLLGFARGVPEKE